MNVKGAGTSNASKDTYNVPSTKVLVVVLKCTTQVMLQVTKWIVQEQSSVTDLVKPDDAVCSTNIGAVFLHTSFGLAITLLNPEDREQSGNGF